MEKEIRILVAPSTSEVGTKSLFGQGGIDATIQSISISKLKANLAALAEDISNMLPDIPQSQGMRLKQITAGVEISAEGGITLIGSLTAGAKAALTLTFEME